MTRVSRISNASLWRPYHWRKHMIVSRLPELYGRVVGRGARGQRCKEGVKTEVPGRGGDAEEAGAAGGMPLAAEDFRCGCGDVEETESEVEVETDSECESEWQSEGEDRYSRACSHVLARAGTGRQQARPRSGAWSAMRGAKGGVESGAGTPGDVGVLRVEAGGGRVRDESGWRDCLESCKYLDACPLSTGPSLDLAANEYYCFLGQSQSVLNTIKDTGAARDTSMHNRDHFGGGIVVSPSAFRANMSVACAQCGGGHIGAAAGCRCMQVGASEQCLMIVRVVLGDCLVVKDYDEVGGHGWSRWG